VAAAAVPPSADDELEELAEMVAASSDDEKAASKNIDCQDDVEADGSDTECEDTDDDADPTAEEVRAALLGQQDISKSRPRKRQRQERASAPACLPLGQLLELALQDTYVREMCPATLPLVELTLVFPNTSVDTERDFSELTQIVTGRRARLKSHHKDELLRVNKEGPRQKDDVRKFAQLVADEWIGAAARKTQ
jgi:hypothetical protein